MKKTIFFAIIIFFISCNTHSQDLSLSELKDRIDFLQKEITYLNKALDRSEKSLLTKELTIEVLSSRLETFYSLNTLKDFNLKLFIDQLSKVQDELKKLDSTKSSAFEMRIYDLEIDIKTLYSNFEELVFQLDEISNKIDKKIIVDTSQVNLEELIEKNKLLEDRVIILEKILKILE
jgi:hypothetical protein|tara:strand:- start:251 stop:781 length:531 start_codon:yes stop_codon:yes gene_type:complete